MTTSAKVGNHIIGVLAAPARLLERSRGRKRLALVTLYLLIASVIGVFAWREASLRGLPNVIEPFDVEAFRSERVPDADDAYPLYQQAFKRLKPLPQNLGVRVPNLATWASLASGRPPDKPVYHRWTQENAEALQLWRRATEKPDVNWPPGYLWRWMNADTFSEFSCLAAEQAHLAETRGDPAEAWRWRLAILRSYRHFSRRGEGHTRETATMATHAVAGQIVPILDAADGQVLRRMLVDLKAVVAMTPPNSETIKASYLKALEELPQRMPDPPTLLVNPEFQWYERSPTYLQARKFFRHEPERSLRLWKIVTANQLVYADRPQVDRLPIAPPGMFDTAFDPSAPREARHLDPPTAATWAETSMMPPTIFPSCVTIADRDRHAIEDLLLDVARELYRRDHAGTLPPNAATLVGPYLDKLPEVSKAMGETMP